MQNLRKCDGKMYVIGQLQTVFVEREKSMDWHYKNKV